MVTLDEKPKAQPIVDIIDKLKIIIFFLIFALLKTISRREYKLQTGKKKYLQKTLLRRTVIQNIQRIPNTQQ